MMPTPAALQKRPRRNLTGLDPLASEEPTSLDGADLPGGWRQEFRRRGRSRRRVGSRNAPTFGRSAAFVVSNADESLDTDWRGNAHPDQSATTGPSYPRNPGRRGRRASRFCVWCGSPLPGKPIESRRSSLGIDHPKNLEQLLPDRCVRLKQQARTSPPSRPPMPHVAASRNSALGTDMCLARSSRGRVDRDRAGHTTPQATSEESAPGGRESSNPGTEWAPRERPSPDCAGGTGDGVLPTRDACRGSPPSPIRWSLRTGGNARWQAQAAFGSSVGRSSVQSRISPRASCQFRTDRGRQAHGPRTKK